MAKIAIIGTPAFGHVIPMLGPIAELVRRDHEVIVYNSIEFEQLITQTGAQFVAFSSTLAEDFSRELKEGSHQSAYPFLLDWPRPPRLLSHPEPIETMALLPDHPPVWFSWRGIRRRVTRADGPERVFGEWWQRDAELIAVRDYFQVEDESGERFWIYRAGDGEDPATGSHKWFMHGVFA